MSKLGYVSVGFVGKFKDAKLRSPRELRGLRG
jgi:hypothetical protein